MSHPAVRHVALSETALSVDDLVGHLDEPASGGLVTFVGRVRNHDRGREVVGLEYSAHPTALATLRSVCDRVAEQYDVGALAAEHRVGDLGVGEVTVIVATTSGHRGGAFEACRALIDTLKSEVPIWKHQLFADGTDEWVGSP